MPEFILPSGLSVTLPEDPQRIVSFSPAVTETLFELGLGDRIVGVSAFCSRPAETKNIRKVGSYGSTRMEVLDDLKPDLILTISGFQKDLYEKIRERFPVYIFELPSSVAGIIDMVSKIGVVTNRKDEARSLEFQMIKIFSSIRKHPEIRGYVEIDLGGPVSFGSESYITDALALMGIKSIYSNFNSEWLQPEDSFVLESDPEIIFYEPKMYSKFSDEKLKDLIAKRGWDRTAAFKNDRIFRTPGTLDFFAHHGPSFIWEVLPWIQNITDQIM
jgi:ABC-type Fe3+-hydroxamate transport system substrate-binding protein